jgi:hypothetical protein
MSLMFYLRHVAFCSRYGLLSLITYNSNENFICIYIYIYKCDMSPSFGIISKFHRLWNLDRITCVFWWAVCVPSSPGTVLREKDQDDRRDREERAETFKGDILYHQVCVRIAVTSRLKAGIFWHHKRACPPRCMTDRWADFATVH